MVDVSLNIKGKGARETAADIDKVARATDNFGDEAAQAKRKLEGLNREILKTEAELKGLARSFDKLDDKSFAKSFAQKERDLAKLKRIRKQLAGVDSAPGGGGGGKSAVNGELRLPGLDLIKNIGPGGFAGGGPVALGALAGVGGIAGTAILGGLGIGAVAGGAALAASSNDRVQGAFSGFGKDTMKSLQADAVSFAQPLVDAAETFGDAFARQESRIRGMFDTAAQFVEPLSKGVAGFAESVLPGLENALKEAAPVIQELGRDLPRLGQSLGDFLDLVGDGGEGAAGTLDKLTGVLDVLMITLGGSIAGLSKLAEGLSFVEDKFPGTLLGFTGIIADAREQRQVMIHAGDATETYAKSLDHVNASTQKTVAAIHEMSGAYDELLNKNIDAAEANLRFNQGLLDLKESVKENGTSLRENTAHGIANRQAILGLVAAAESNRMAQEKATGDTYAANRAFTAQIDAIRKTAASLGFNKQQIDALLASIGALNRTPLVEKTLKINLSANALAKAMLSGHNPLLNGPAIKSYDTGGPVPGPPGKPQLAVVHGGEYVVPRQGAAMTGGMAMARGGRSTVDVRGGGTGLDRVFRSWMQREIRTGRIVIRDRDVQ